MSIIGDIVYLDVYRLREDVGDEHGGKVLTLDRVSTGCAYSEYAHFALTFPVYTPGTNPAATDLSYDIDPSAILPAVTATPIPVGDADVQDFTPIFPRRIDAAVDCANYLRFRPGPTANTGRPEFPDLQAFPPLVLESAINAAPDDVLNLSKFVLQFAGAAMEDARVPEETLMQVAGTPPRISAGRVRRIILNAGLEQWGTMFYVVRRENRKKDEPAPVPHASCSVRIGSNSFVAFGVFGKPGRPLFQIVPLAEKAKLSLALSTETSRALGQYNIAVQIIRSSRARLSEDVKNVLRQMQDVRNRNPDTGKFYETGPVNTLIRVLVNGIEPFSSARRTLLDQPNTAEIARDLSVWAILVGMICPEVMPQIDRLNNSGGVSTVEAILGVSQEFTLYQRAFLAWLVARYVLLVFVKEVAPVGGELSSEQQKHNDAYDAMCKLYELLVQKILRTRRTWGFVLHGALSQPMEDWDRTWPDVTAEQLYEDAALWQELYSIVYAVRSQWLTSALYDARDVRDYLRKTGRRGRLTLFLLSASPLDAQTTREEIIAYAERKSGVAAVAFSGRLNREGDWPSLIASSSRVKERCGFPETVVQVGEDPGEIAPLETEVVLFDPRRGPAASKRPRLDDQTGYVVVDTDTTMDVQVDAPPGRPIAVSDAIMVAAEARARELVLPAIREEVATEYQIVIAERERTIATLRQQIDDLTARLSAPDTCPQELTQAQRRIDELSRKLQETRSAVADAEAKLLAAEDACGQRIASATQAVLQDARMFMDSMKSDTEEDVQLFTAEVDKLAGKLEDSKRSHLDALERELVCRRTVRERSMQITTLQQKLDLLERQNLENLQSADAEIRQVRRDLADCRSKLEGREEALRVLSEKIRDYEQRSGAATPIDSGRMEVEIPAAQAAEIAELQRSLDEAQADRDAARMELNQARGRERGFIVQIQSIAQELQDAIDGRAAFSVQFEALRDERDALEDKVAMLERELAIAKGVECPPPLPPRDLDVEARARLREEYESKVRAIQQACQARLDESTASFNQQCSVMIAQVQAEGESERAALREQVARLQEALRAGSSSNCSAQVDQARREARELALREFELSTAELRRRCDELKALQDSTVLRCREMQSEYEQSIKNLELLFGIRGVSPDAASDETFIAMMQPRIDKIRDAVWKARAMDVEQPSNCAKELEKLNKCEQDLAAAKNTEAALRQAANAAEAAWSVARKELSDVKKENQDLLATLISRRPDARPSAPSAAAFEGSDDLRKIVVAALLSQLRANPRSGGIGFALRVNDLKE